MGRSEKFSVIYRSSYPAYFSDQTVDVLIAESNSTLSHSASMNLTGMTTVTVFCYLYAKRAPLCEATTHIFPASTPSVRQTCHRGSEKKRPGNCLITRQNTFTRQSTVQESATGAGYMLSHKLAKQSKPAFDSERSVQADNERPVCCNKQPNLWPFVCFMSQWCPMGRNTVSKMVTKISVSNKVCKEDGVGERPETLRCHRDVYMFHCWDAYA